MDFTPISPLWNLDSDEEAVTDLPSKDDLDDDDDDDDDDDGDDDVEILDDDDDVHNDDDDVHNDDDDDDDEEEEEKELDESDDDDEEEEKEEDFVTPAKTGKSKPRPTGSGGSTGSDAKFKATTLIGDGVPLFPGSGILSYKGISF